MTTTYTHDQLLAMPQDERIKALGSMPMEGVIAFMKAQEEHTSKALAAAKAKVHTGNGISCKVSDKGALSVYGLGRFPTTLYRSQWEKLIANVDQIKAFISANESKLTVKGQ